MNTVPPNNSINNFSNTISFGGNRLFAVNVLKKAAGSDVIGGIVREHEPELCYFTHINSEDIPLMMKLKDLWASSTYGKKLINAFLETLRNPKRYKGANFFMIESAEKTNPRDRVKAIARVKRNDKNELEVECLQSVSAMKGFPYTKGAGQAMMYSLGKLASAQNMAGISLGAAESARDFYSKIGMNVIGLSRFGLPKADYGNFFENIESKLRMSSLKFELKEGSLF